MTRDSARVSVVEALGYAPESKLAVVHADDIGMCHAANVGAFEALAAGPASCGSVMVPCPWFPEAAARARANPAFDLGVHLTLNAEWSHYRWAPVLGAEAVPSLCDAEGYLPRTVPESLQAEPGEVERELRAQIDRALAAGIDVTHLDAHMATAYLPPFAEIYGRLLRDYRLPGFLVRPEVSQLGEAPALQAMLGEVIAMVDRAEADGFTVFDGFDDRSLGFELEAGHEHNLDRIASLGVGLNYLITHPARIDDELRAITADAHCRDFERAFYGSSTAVEALRAAGVEVVGMRALRDLLRAER